VKEVYDMKVKVYTGPLCEGAALDEDGFIELPEGATVADALKKVNCPLPVKMLGLYSVNYQRATLNTKLKEGDVISILAPIVGG